ncbi:potassium channel family protein [Methanosarcina siciliae]|uniref:potassium channel family protein n=1 Tax=Methanosarcina siciliae TaxID=38027 RepID=UPI00164FE8D3|nr:potassium channel family protein [Methanosarcina siciliae]
MRFLVLTTMSTISLATEYRDVRASEILKQIENGEDVNLTDCRIIGELNLSEIEVETVPNPKYSELLESGFFDGEDLKRYGVNKDLKVVESNIKIRNSIFENDLDFSNALFNKSLFFVEGNFTSTVNFLCTTFGDFASFIGATFGDSSYFLNTTFKSISLYGIDFEEMWVRWDSLENSLVFDGLTYVKLVRNFRNLEQFEEADAAYYQYRKLRQAEKSWILFQKEWPWISFPKCGDIFMWLTCGYGVKPFRAFGFGGLIVLSFSFFYRGWPAISLRSEEKIDRICRLLPERLQRFIPTIDWPNPGISRLEPNKHTQKVSFWDAFYFSMVTFATIGYGDWYPKDKFRKWVMIEGFLGWLTLGLFLVTLTNVTIRP